MRIDHYEQFFAVLLGVFIIGTWWSKLECMKQPAVSGRHNVFRHPNAWLAIILGSAANCTWFCIVEGLTWLIAPTMVGAALLVSVVRSHRIAIDTEGIVEKWLARAPRSMKWADLAHASRESSGAIVLRAADGTTILVPSELKHAPFLRALLYHYIDGSHWVGSGSELNGT